MGVNSDEIWLLQLWSGAIGSFVAAVLGGLVALFVVRLTNCQQRRSAAEAREIAAISEFVSQMQVLSVTFQNPEEFKPREQMAALFSAVVKLHMGGPSVKGLADVLDEWPSELVNMATMDVRTRAQGMRALKTDVHEILADAGAIVFRELRNWHLEDNETRKSHLTTLIALGVRTHGQYEFVREDYKLAKQLAADLESGKFDS